MKKTILFTILSILALSFAAQAQESDRYSSSRLDNLAAELKRITVDLADRTSEDLLRNNARNRRDIEAAFLAQQLDASTGLFQQMTRNGSNRAAELRDATAILTDLARRAPNYGSSSNLWRNAQNAINDINRELGSVGGGDTGGGYGGGIGGGNGGGSRVGSVLWRGTVDDRVQLIIRGNSLSVETISGRAYPEGNFSFTSSLPKRNVNAEVTKKSGRGEARVIQQPSRDNDYTTIVEILDGGSGAKEYQLEISWR